MVRLIKYAGAGVLLAAAVSATSSYPTEDEYPTYGDDDECPPETSE